MIKEGDSGISHAMKRLGTSCAYWYNWKHKHTGHVFQDRFKSECVENDTYLITVIRYIHRNPVKAKLVLKPDDYYWSSCRVYYGMRENPPDLTQTQLILGFFEDRKEKAVERMRFFEAEDNDDQCLDGFKQKRLSQEIARQVITEKLNGRPIGELQLIKLRKKPSFCKKRLLPAPVDAEVDYDDENTMTIRLSMENLKILFIKNFFEEGIFP